MYSICVINPVKYQWEARLERLNVVFDTQCTKLFADLVPTPAIFISEVCVIPTVGILKSFHLKCYLAKYMYIFFYSPDCHFSPYQSNKKVYANLKLPIIKLEEAISCEPISVRLIIHC